MTRGVGTFLYRAPEVAQHKAYDSGADMYSLGVVAFELLRGAPYGTAMERVLREMRHTVRPRDDVLGE